MRIVEPDFVLDSNNGFWDLIFYKKVKNKETEQIEIKPYKAAYGCTLASAINRIVKHRVRTIYESENPCLLDALNKLIELETEMIHLCKESLPEKFDNGE